MRYRERIVDNLLDEILPHVPALSLEGPKGVGKTATASRRVHKIFKLDVPEDVELFNAYDFDSQSNTLFTQQEIEVSNREKRSSRVLIDEWQRVPSSWDKVRRAVDDGTQGILLTGSAYPAGASIHSGAGRILRFRMRPLSLWERLGEDLVEEIVSSDSGLSISSWGQVTSVHGETSWKLENYIQAIVESGLPGIRTQVERARRLNLESYVERICTHEFEEQGMMLRHPEKLLAWMRAYAAATATTTSYTNILDAATPGETKKPTQKTTKTYRKMLEHLWILDAVPAWLPSNTKLQTLSKAPKHFLADPALACTLLNFRPSITESSPNEPWVRTSKTLLGRMFESLVALSLQTYAQHCDAKLYHFRDAKGLREVDFIFERGPHEVIGIEVKLSASVGDDDVKHLNWLQEKLGSALKARIIVTTGSEAYTRRDGVHVVPFALLRP